MKKYLVKYNWILSQQFGLNFPKLIQGVLRIPWFIHSIYSFKRKYNGRFDIYPCLHDINTESGVSRGEYFWQDLFVARLIHMKNPILHVDIGSRIDGFVANVASFREIEVLDIRENNSSIPGIKFKKLDICDSDSVASLTKNFDGYCDSLSSLHVLEHFGLGRYGDKIDPSLFEVGFSNMSKLLKTGGTFYLSTPVGKEKVLFNANYIFSPTKIINYASLYNLKIVDIYVFNENKGMVDINRNFEIIDSMENSDYTLCIFIFEKIKH